jgi:hypothetical protein
MKRQLLILTFALAALAAAAQQGRAQVGCDYGYGGCWDGGYGWLYNTLRYEVPHFAAFPPVYYSVPVPRTYGYSPFAYPPYIMTPEVVGESQPLTIDNPYVPATKTAKPPAANGNSDRAAAIKRASEPLVIVNPYVTARGSIASTDE